MASLPVLDMAGKKVGDCNIDASAIAPKICKQLLHDAVVMYQANRRQGSHRTKNRSEVSYSTKKLYRQKGTGNARAGSRGSGIRRGGGHIFAKRPRDYSYALNRKALQAATRMAIADKLNSGEVIVVDQWSIAEPKTKKMAGILKAIGAGGQTALLATDKHDPGIYLSARNLAGVSVMPGTDINAYEVLSKRRLVLTRNFLQSLAEKVAAGKKSKS